MNFFANLAELCQPPDERTAIDWSAEHVKPPNSARCKTGFDPRLSPWLGDPINARADTSLAEVVVLAPTGGGKTTIYDCCIPHIISEDPDNLILAVQGNNQAKIYVEGRLMQILRKIKRISSIMAGMNRHAIKKGSVIFPHMVMHMGGVNETNAQANSVRDVFIDEAWLAEPYGIIEQFRARTHDRWNGKVFIVSQGGITQFDTEDGIVETELEIAWKRTDQQVYHFRCPECGDLQRFRLKGLRYDKGSREDGSIDERAIRQSAHLVCLGKCGTKFEDKDTVRYALSSGGLYVPTNPDAEKQYRGYQVNALALHYVPWGKIAVEHATGLAALKVGNPERMKIFRQKRMAENYRPQEAVPDVILATSDYVIADYANGEKWANELRRFMTIDRQLNHRWVVIKAWGAGGNRLLWEGRVNTKEGCRELQGKYGVLDPLVAQDGNYDRGEVYRECAEYGWTAMHGDDADKGYLHKRKKGKSVMRAYSQPSPAQASNGKFLRYFWFSNLLVKDELMAIRQGLRGKAELPRDVSDDYQKQNNNEAKRDIFGKDGRLTQRYIPVTKPANNHLWDCEVGQTAFAMMFNLLPESETPAEDTEEVEAAA